MVLQFARWYIIFGEVVDDLKYPSRYIFNGNYSSVAFLLPYHHILFSTILLGGTLLHMNNIVLYHTYL